MSALCTRGLPLAGWGLLAMAVLAQGCDPGMYMRGTVRQAPDRCRAQGQVQAAGAPIEDATAQLECPGDPRPLLIASTDEQGRFDDGTVGLMGMDCVVAVEKDGFQRRAYPVSALCSVRAGDDYCQSVTVVAELWPVSPPPQPEP